jgi:hypothetical protein
MVEASSVKVAKIVSAAFPAKLVGLILGHVCALRIQESSVVRLGRSGTEKCLLMAMAMAMAMAVQSTIFYYYLNNSQIQISVERQNLPPPQNMLNWNLLYRILIGNSYG